MAKQGAGTGGILLYLLFTFLSTTQLRAEGIFVCREVFAGGDDEGLGARN